MVCIHLLLTCLVLISRFQNSGRVLSAQDAQSTEIGGLHRSESLFPYLWTSLLVSLLICCFVLTRYGLHVDWFASCIKDILTGSCFCVSLHRDCCSRWLVGPL